MKTLLIGERLNSSNKKVRAFFEAGDIPEILNIARRQLEAGADVIDINCSMMMDRERELLFLSGEAVIEQLNIDISVDSPDIEVLMEGARRFGRACILNSITCKEDEVLRVGDVAAGSGSGVIVMTKDGSGIPSSPKGRIELASKAARLLGDVGLEEEKIFFDPVFSPVATDVESLSTALETLRLLKTEFPACRRVGGLSNISFGLPDRRLVNRSFLPLALQSGLNTVICDVTDERLMDVMAATEAVTGLDPGCKGYLKHYRSRKQ